MRGVGLEMLGGLVWVVVRGGGVGEGEGRERGLAWVVGKGGRYFSEKGVVDLFCRADFYGFHHFAGGDDDAAEGGGGSRWHGAEERGWAVVGFWWVVLVVRGVVVAWGCGKRCGMKVYREDGEIYADESGIGGAPPYCRDAGDSGMS